MVRECDDTDFETIHALINEAAEAYRGVIPDDCWHEPYMTPDAFRHEIDAGVVFWGLETAGALVGVMGLQHVLDVTLIRHAYVRPSSQRQGTGGRLLGAIREKTQRPLLVGTWAAAVWAIRFYEKHGFRLVPTDEKDRLLATYWSIPDRQIETSVVLRESAQAAGGCTP